jgi:hypothetical protein
MKVEPSLNPKLAGRFYVGSDGGFSAEQYTDMIMTQLFDSAKDAPQPLKTQILEFKLQAANIIHRYVVEAMADATRRVGRQYELHDKKKARLMLPSGMGERLDQGGIWDEATVPVPTQTKE